MTTHNKNKYLRQKIMHNNNKYVRHIIMLNINKFKTSLGIIITNI